MSGYRGYRGLRRKFRAQQPCRSPLSLSLSSFLWLSPSAPASGVRRTPAASVFRVRGPREPDPSFPWLRAASTGPYTKDEHKDNHISRTYILAAYQSWTLTTGVRSWRLTMVVMTGHSRVHRRTAALNHPRREWFHLEPYEAGLDTYPRARDFRSYVPLTKSHFAACVFAGVHRELKLPVLLRILLITHAVIELSTYNSC